jgi:hypothetical protein
LAIALVAEFAKRGVAAVWLAKVPDAADKLAKEGTPTPGRYRRIPLDTVAQAICWAYADDVVAVGDLLFRQIQGLGQGAPTSPVLTRLRLDTHHHSFYTRPRELEAFANHPALWKEPWRVLGSSFHVDDAIWWSFRYCHDCTISAIEAIWPPDVGLTVEAREHQFEYLHCSLTFRQAPVPALVVDIRHVNREFAIGHTTEPKVSSFIVYNNTLPNRRHLRLALFAKLWLVAGNYCTARKSSAAFTIVGYGLEILRSGWPEKTLCDMLLEFKCHKFRYINGVTRTLGVWLRRHRAYIGATRIGTAKWDAIADAWQERAGFPAGGSS